MQKKSEKNTPQAKKQDSLAQQLRNNLRRRKQVKKNNAAPKTS